MAVVARSSCSPLDGGLTFRGRRMFGENKTARGFVVMVPATALAFPLVASSSRTAVPRPPASGRLSPPGTRGSARGRGSASCSASCRTRSSSASSTSLRAAAPADRLAWSLAARRRSRRLRGRHAGRAQLRWSRAVADMVVVLFVGTALHWLFSVVLFRSARKRGRHERGALVVPLADARDAADVGGKAANLARLIRSGTRCRTDSSSPTRRCARPSPSPQRAFRRSVDRGSRLAA